MSARQPRHPLMLLLVAITLFFLTAHISNLGNKQPTNDKMTTDPYCPPPPYTPSDPLTPATTQAPESPLRHDGRDGQIPAYSPATAIEHVAGGSPTFNDTVSPYFSSAAVYFEECGLRTDHHDNMTMHQLFVSPAGRAEDITLIPLCWRRRASDLTQGDMSTFTNFLLPPGANSR